MLNVHCIYESDQHGDPYGCSYIRLIQPLSYPGVEKSIRVTFSADLSSEKCNIIIVERLYQHGSTLDDVITLVEQIKLSGATFIYTIDDNLIDLHKDEPWLNNPSESDRMAVRYLLREADGVIVSTKNLQKRFLNLNNNMAVIPNALDDLLFKKDGISNNLGKNSDSIKIGYMGTRTHQKDLMMVLEPLREILHEFKTKVTLELVGVMDDSLAVKLFNDLNVKVVSPAQYRYPDFVNWIKTSINWDIAIAPLTDDHFNRFKSDIKFLDYSILGIPGIYSDVDSYNKTVKSNVTGLLVKNDSQAWYNGLHRMITDHALRSELSTNARNYVDEERSLKVSYQQWLNTVVDMHKSRIL